MENALEIQNLQILATLGHRIKSPTRTVGAMSFANLCASNWNSSKIKS